MLRSQTRENEAPPDAEIKRKPAVPLVTGLQIRRPLAPSASTNTLPNKPAFVPYASASASSTVLKHSSTRLDSRRPSENLEDELNENTAALQLELDRTQEIMLIKQETGELTNTIRDNWHKLSALLNIVEERFIDSEQTKRKLNVALTEIERLKKSLQHALDDKHNRTQKLQSSPLFQRDLTDIIKELKMAVAEGQASAVSADKLFEQRAQEIIALETELETVKQAFQLRLDEAQTQLQAAETALRVEQEKFKNLQIEHEELKKTEHQEKILREVRVAGDIGLRLERILGLLETVFANNGTLATPKVMAQNSSAKEELKQEVELSSIQTLKALSSRLSHIEQLMEATKSRENAAQQHYHIAVQQKEALALAKLRLDALAAQLNEAQQRLKHDETERMTLQHELRLKIEEVKQQTQQITNLQDQLRETQNVLGFLRDENALLQTRLAYTLEANEALMQDRSLAKNNDLQLQYDELSARYTAQEEQLRQALLNIKRLSENEVLLVELRTKLAQAEALKKETQQKLQDSETSSAEMQEKLLGYEATILEIQTRLAETEAARREDTQKIASLEADLEQANADSDAAFLASERIAESDRRISGKIIEDFKAERDKALAEVERLKAELESSSLLDKEPKGAAAPQDLLSRARADGRGLQAKGSGSMNAQYQLATRGLAVSEDYAVNGIRQSAQENTPLSPIKTHAK